MRLDTARAQHAHAHAHGTWYMVHGWNTHVHGICMVHHAYPRIYIAASATQRPRWRASLSRSAFSSTRRAASYRCRPRVALVSTAIVATRPGSTRGVRPRAQVLHSRHSTCTHMRMHMCTSYAHVASRRVGRSARPQGWHCCGVGSVPLQCLTSTLARVTPPLPRPLYHRCS